MQTPTGRLSRLLTLRRLTVKKILPPNDDENWKIFFHVFSSGKAITTLLESDTKTMTRYCLYSQLRLLFAIVILPLNIYRCSWQEWEESIFFSTVRHENISSTPNRFVYSVVCRSPLSRGHDRVFVPDTMFLLHPLHVRNQLQLLDYLNE